MRLSVVIPTKNEEANVGACLDAFAAFREEVELIVVDNASLDRTREIVAERGVRVYVQGPERCAQRNRGWREAQGDFVMFVDADMIVRPETIREILAGIAADTADAWYVREVRAGRGLRLQARNFERSFYDATCIDGLRVIRRIFLEKVGGYDESLVACEDWDLDRRLLAAGARTALTKGSLVHNEARQTLSVLLKKKAYYAKSVDVYRRKWGNDTICRRQFGLFFRFFGIFFRRGGWRRLLAHPVLAVTMYTERILVGVVYLFGKG